MRFVISIVTALISAQKMSTGSTSVVASNSSPAPAPQELVSGFEAHARLSGEPARPNRRRWCSGTDSQGADDAGCGGSRCQYASAERIRSE